MQEEIKKALKERGAISAGETETLEDAVGGENDRANFDKAMEDSQMKILEQDRTIGEAHAKKVREQALQEHNNFCP